jgi:hypothetical protein
VSGVFVVGGVSSSKGTATAVSGGTGGAGAGEGGGAGTVGVEEEEEEGVVVEEEEGTNFEAFDRRSTVLIGTILGAEAHWPYPLRRRQLCRPQASVLLHRWSSSMPSLWSWLLLRHSLFPSLHSPIHHGGASAHPSVAGQACDTPS